MQAGWEYCRRWNRERPLASPRTACGPCDVCQAPGHVGAHPRQPTSVCLCERHWAEVSAPGYRFELYHLVYVAIAAIVVATLYPKMASLF